MCFQVAEFANIRKQLEVLEGRLDAMVQPRLTDALSNRKVIFFLQSFLFMSLISFIACGSSTPFTNILYLFCMCYYYQIDIARDLREILIRIGRFKSLELHYTKVHLKHIKQLWEDFDSRQRSNKFASEKNEVERLASNNEFQSSSPPVAFSSWLPSFYDELLLYLEQEWKWYISYCSLCKLSHALSCLFERMEARAIHF